MLLSFDNLYKYFGDRLVLSNLSAVISRGDRIGLVGVNGAGKSTLAALITGGLSADEGSVSRAGGLSVGFLKQDGGLSGGRDIYGEMKSVFAKTQAAGDEAAKIIEQLSGLCPESAEYSALSREHARLCAIFEAGDGYNIDVRIKKVLGGMGFGGFDLKTPIETLSGGEKTRLAIAKLLLEEPDLLILDEPTNHLDFETLSWLEGYLSSWKGALLLISHDRYFLDRLVTRIWELEGQELLVFRGNYSDYRRQKEALNERLQKEYEKYENTVSSMLDYAQRNMARASTSGSAKSRLHRLANMEEVKPPKKPQKPPSMEFKITALPVKEVLSVSDFRLSAGDGESAKLLCESVSFSVTRGDRLAIVGPNGAGKSTLLKKFLSSAGKNRVPEIKWGGGVSLAFYDQENKNLNPSHTLLEELLARCPRFSDFEARSLLGRLLFSGEDVYKRVSALSGGERARLGFAVVMGGGANTLLLDEPTNHIDLAAREALEKALSRFEGTLIFVSHDRYFINAVATRVLEFCDNNIFLYKGGYDDYLAEKAKAPILPASPSKKSASGGGESYYRSKLQRSRDTALRKRISELERLIDEAAALEEKLTGRLSLPEVASDYETLQSICAELEKARADFESYTEEWLALSEESQSL